MKGAWNIAAAALVAVLSSCAGSATIVSRRNVAYSRPVDRMIVFVEPGRIPAVARESFKAQLASKLEVLGVSVRVGEVRPRTEEGRTLLLLEQAKAFHASTALLISPSDRAWEAGGSVLQPFDAEIVDLSLGKVVWRAEIEWSTGSILRAYETAARAWVEELLKALELDGMLAGVTNPSESVRNAQ